MPGASKNQTLKTALKVMLRGERNGEQKANEDWHKQGAWHKRIYFGHSTLVKISYSVHYNNWLQNVTDIIKELQNARSILLKNTRKIYYKISQVFCLKMQQIITKCISHSQMLRFCYKNRKLLQHVKFIEKYIITERKKFRLQIFQFFHNNIHNLCWQFW